MKTIPTFLATMVVATWLFMIGFAAGFEHELATDPTLTREHPDAALAGLTMGVSAVAAVLVIAASVRLTKALVRARSREMHAAL
ncbi:hypothetical protein ASE14_13820 [Agromyces sp. Root81]|uniref:hypothetical protein n=1 Tax=Agromyces sp. Root81 TaxID=1736601 RepID=UPI0006FE7FAF|nr:hypothetical protein [Agromyces sp. Root81]KRC61866.1 hypothetical protein ASE14_13820 [Agromyces sp. Root81]